MRRGIGTKVVALTVTGIAATSVAMVGLSVWQSGAIAEEARTDVALMVDDSVARITNGVYDMVATQGDSTAAAVDKDMQVAQYVAAQAGGLTVAPPVRGTVAWEAKNQVTGDITPVELPRVMAGETWLGQNADPAVPTPVVDQTEDLVGGTATVFQRIPGTGDMLRVATNVVAATGKRAIGTYIPQFGPDGAPSKVVEAVLAGQTYRGTAFVVDSWYVTSYAPLFDGGGQVVGMIYVGQKQENLPALRESLQKTTAGENGTLWVLGGTGDRAGTVLVSADGSADGTSLMDVQDADGRPYVQDIVAAATALEEGEQATVRYEDADTGPHTVHVAYYAPWDWVIVVDAQDSDFAGPLDRLTDGRTAMTTALVVAAVLVAAAGAALAWSMGRRITAPLTVLRDRMAEIADGEGDLTQRADDSSRDEVGELAGAFNRFVDKVAGTIRDIGSCRPRRWPPRRPGWPGSPTASATGRAAAGTRPGPPRRRPRTSAPGCPRPRPGPSRWAPPSGRSPAAPPTPPTSAVARWNWPRRPRPRSPRWAPAPRRSATSSGSSPRSPSRPTCWP